MTEPITTPGERTRRELEAANAARNEETARINAAVSLVRIEMLIEEYGSKLNEHIRDDTEFQKEIREAVKEAGEKIVVVNKSVADEQLKSRFTLKEFVVGAITLTILIGGLIGFIGHWLTQGKSP